MVNKQKSTGNDNPHLVIVFGVLAEPISLQIKSQGLLYNIDYVRRYQRQADAIYELRMGGVLSDSQTDSITKKLFAKIRAHVAKANKLGVKKEIIEG